MTTHTKRTDGFNQAIDHLRNRIAEVKAGNGHLHFEHHELDVLDSILRHNTTDSACIVRAADDEPIFTLRAKDQLSDDVVRCWVNMAIVADIHEDKRVDAAACATQMQE